MSVYVDTVRWYPDEAIGLAARRHGNLWAHLWADSDAELNQVAREIGLSSAWLQTGSLRHYDVTPSRRGKALATGLVVERELRDWFRERRAERVTHG